MLVTFDNRYLKAISSELDPYSPLTTQLSPDDLIDNDMGTVFLSSGPYWAIEARPSTTFVLGSVTFRARNVGTSTEVSFNRYGIPYVIPGTAAGIEGVNVTNDLRGADVTIEQPPPTSTPPPSP